jgi:hypothetical protein
MPTEDTPTSSSGLDVTKLLSELEVPFSPDQVRWRVTNTTNDKRRGQIVPYADCRAYTDRLNALFTPQGWTRDYKVETMTNITRVKKGESIVSGKVLVTCTVTILGIGSHSGTGDDLDARILYLEKTVGTVLYRNILREYGHVNQPKLIRDPAVKRTVLQMLESATRGIERLNAVTKRLDAKTVEALLAKLQAPPTGQIPDMKTLQHVVFGLEELAGSDQHHAA